jgi:hypothetical protein
MFFRFILPEDRAMLESNSSAEKVTVVYRDSIGIYTAELILL